MSNTEIQDFFDKLNDLAFRLTGHKPGNNYIEYRPLMSIPIDRSFLYLYYGDVLISDTQKRLICASSLEVI